MSMLCLTTRRVLVLCSLWLLPLSALASEPSEWDAQVHGFLTQGFVKTSANRFFGPSDKGSFKFTEIGINGSIRPRSSLLLTGQLLSRRAGEMYDGSPTVDFALARWDYLDTKDYLFSISIGRVKNPIGLYNKTRDVAHTRPSVFLPQPVYYDKVRNLEHSSDGVELVFNHFGKFGELAFDLVVGRLLSDQNMENTLLGRDWGGRLKADGLARLAQLRFSTADERWRFALNHAKGGFSFEPGPTDPLGNGRSDFTLIGGSAQFSDERWTITAEFILEPIEQEGYTPFVDSRQTAESYYLQVQHHLSPRWSLLTRYGEAYADRDDREGTRLAATWPGSQPFHFYSKILTFGARWNITPRLMIEADYSINEGTLILSNRENTNPTALQKHWTMFSLLTSYRF